MEKLPHLPPEGSPASQAPHLAEAGPIQVCQAGLETEVDGTKSFSHVREDETEIRHSGTTRSGSPATWSNSGSEDDANAPDEPHLEPDYRPPDSSDPQANTADHDATTQCEPALSLDASDKPRAMLSKRSVDEPASEAGNSADVRDDSPEPELEEDVPSVAEGNGLYVLSSQVNQTRLTSDIHTGHDSGPSQTSSSNTSRLTTSHPEMRKRRLMSSSKNLENENKINVPQKHRTPNLGFTSQDVCVEDPAIVARRERSKFMHAQGGLRNAAHKDEGRKRPRSPGGVDESDWAKKNGHASRSQHQAVRFPLTSARRHEPVDVDMSASNHEEGLNGPRPSSSENRQTPPSKRRRVDETAGRGFSAMPPPSTTSPQVDVSRRSDSDPFVTFVGAYPDYDGGRRHFETMCEEIGSLGKSLHRFLWDDYIIRHSLEYDDSTGLRYRDFYNEHVDEPIYMKRIINPNTLAVTLELAQAKSAARQSNQASRRSFVKSVPDPNRSNTPLQQTDNAVTDKPPSSEYSSSRISFSKTKHL